MDKRIKKLKKKMIRTKMLQEELEHRNEIEKKVFKLFLVGKFKEGQKLLNTLDNEKFKKLAGDEIDNEDWHMTENKIIKIMSETRKEIQRRRSLSSPYFYDDIWDEEVDRMHLSYPYIEALPQEKYRKLWDKART